MRSYRDGPDGELEALLLLPPERGDNADEEEWELGDSAGGLDFDFVDEDKDNLAVPSVGCVTAASVTAAAASADVDFASESALGSDAGEVTVGAGAGGACILCAF